MQLATFLLVLEDYMLPCFTKKIFGFDCPGCGLQRATLSLVKGDFTAAFEMYPAIYPLVLLILFIITTAFVKIKFELTVKILLAITTGIVILASYIFKMNNLIH